MANEDINLRMRNQKEVINGRVVDNQGVHLDADSIENAILKAASGEFAGDRASEEMHYSGDSEEIDGSIVDKEGVHLDKDSLLANLLGGGKIMPQITSSRNKGKSVTKTANIDLGVYQPIWDELKNIPMSDKMDEEIQILAKAVREAAMEFKAKRIIANTQKVVKNAEKLYYTSNTVRVVFSILGNKYSMSAKGSFTGREIFNLKVSGNDLEGQIFRADEEDEFADVTADFKIGIQRV